MVLHHILEIPINFSLNLVYREDTLNRMLQHGQNTPSYSMKTLHELHLF